jgi:hypothetical protein
MLPNFSTEFRQITTLNHKDMKKWYAIPHRSPSIRRRVLCFRSGIAGMLVSRNHRDRTIENIKDAIREYLSVVDEQLRGEQVRKIEVSV